MCVGGGGGSAPVTPSPWAYWRPPVQDTPLIELNEKAVKRGISASRLGKRMLQIPLTGGLTGSGLGIPRNRGE